MKNKDFVNNLYMYLLKKVQSRHIFEQFQIAPIPVIIIIIENVEISIMGMVYSL